MCMRERAKKSPFYVAYADRKPSHRNLRMRRKKLRKPSYAYAYTLRSQRNHSLRYDGVRSLLTLRSDQQGDTT